ERDDAPHDLGHGRRHEALGLVAVVEVVLEPLVVGVLALYLGGDGRLDTLEDFFVVIGRGECALGHDRDGRAPDEHPREEESANPHVGAHERKKRTNPMSASASAKAMPKNIVVRTWPAISG